MPGSGGLRAGPPAGYPSTLASGIGLQLGTTTYTTRTLTIQARKVGGAAVPNARVDVSGGPVPVYRTVAQWPLITL